ncbi:hypothetical protein SAMN05444671_1052 [Flavobacterium sp. CF108]|uniref:outer membrane beta-barrel protein n=1 Tax=unclassified Flavobacterium TaxID=196869 RepID=UPI0008C6092C|nr:MULTISPECIES: outer membrane beta-barrel protein [unclassified Flavobacterium]SEP34603.1 hypothetical protein SAMN04487978_0674 [Flavobacterium sp. fv08]SHG64287.1 hypothetical protein SAMN05444671_1052 [Flavobacterium sp. CF108]
MKKVVLLAIAFVFFSNSYAQKTELRVSLDSGLSAFSGQSAESSSYMSFSSFTGSGYTNNPYGSKNAFSYGVSVNLKRVTKVNFIYGIGVGYEDLRSKTSLTTVFNDGSNPIPVSGETFMNVNSINVNPFTGYRFNADKFPIDLAAGFDVANILSTKEKGDAADASGNKYTTSRDRKTISTDFRPRIQISTDYKKFGVYLGYSFGLRNYLDGYVGGTNEAYSKIIRFGVTYQVL